MIEDEDDYELAVIAAIRMAKPKDVARMRVFGGYNYDRVLKYMVAQGLVTGPDANGHWRLTPEGEALAEKERLARLETDTQH
jgi:hypothetical protein